MRKAWYLVLLWICSIICVSFGDRPNYDSQSGACSIGKYTMYIHTTYVCNYVGTLKCRIKDHTYSLILVEKKIHPARPY